MWFLWCYLIVIVSVLAIKVVNILISCQGIAYPLVIVLVAILGITRFTCGQEAKKVSSWGGTDQLVLSSSRPSLDGRADELWIELWELMQ